jgi:hypothetical protein
MSERMSLLRLASTILCTSTLLVASVARADDAGAPPAPEAPDAHEDPSAARATRAKSPGLVAGGAVLGLVGVGGIAGGAAIIANNQSSGGFMDFSGFARAGGIGAVVLGVGGFIGGVAMIAIGSEQVPAAPQLSVGLRPGGLSVSGRF